MYSRRKGLTVEETITELYSDTLSDIYDIESSDSETADRDLPTKSVCGKFRSLVQWVVVRVKFKYRQKRQ
jgi:hypothetical protein